ncbi:basic salivary proline-rich protein 2-like [Enhydra lutris kenyoni]|uniref:Basic salivary proline-rich protein 2-like n=1 Tax=Enhydra lutris kenyoni TaxID=391180 RepID=A0A2Y9JTQ8_ENHLU|nr:basic salivary proline-rich protein 2-like [Enhydra lutris kenyoni]
MAGFTRSLAAVARPCSGCPGLSSLLPLSAPASARSPFLPAFRAGPASQATLHACGRGEPRSAGTETELNSPQYPACPTAPGALGPSGKRKIHRKSRPPPETHLKPAFPTRPGTSNSSAPIHPDPSSSATLCPPATLIKPPGFLTRSSIPHSPQAAPPVEKETGDSSVEVLAGLHSRDTGQRTLTAKGEQQEQRLSEQDGLAALLLRGRGMPGMQMPPQVLARTAATREENKCNFPKKTLTLELQQERAAGPPAVHPARGSREGPLPAHPPPGPGQRGTRRSSPTRPPRRKALLRGDRAAGQKGRARGPPPPPGVARGAEHATPRSSAARPRSLSRAWGSPPPGDEGARAYLAEVCGCHPGPARTSLSPPPPPNARQPAAFKSPGKDCPAPRGTSPPRSQSATITRTCYSGRPPVRGRSCTPPSRDQPFEGDGTLFPQSLFLPFATL